MKSNKSSFFREIAFFGSFKLFPSSNIVFWLFLKLLKMEIELFDFTSFFGLDFFKFSGPLCKQKRRLKKNNYLHNLIEDSIIHFINFLGKIESMLIPGVGRSNSIPSAPRLHWH